MNKEDKEFDYRIYFSCVVVGIIGYILGKVI